MSEAKEQKPAAAEAPEQAAPAEASAEKTEAKPEVVEASYKERAKDGDYFFKRRNGKPRFRMISVRKGEAKLFFLFKKEWIQKSSKQGTHGLRWHYKNKWTRIEKGAIPSGK